MLRRCGHVRNNGLDQEYRAETGQTAGAFVLMRAGNVLRRQARLREQPERDSA